MTAMPTTIEHALPILRRHGIRALFFVTTGCLTDRQLFWWERVNLLVRRSEERALRIEYPFAEEIDLSTPAAKAAAKKGLNRIIKTHYDLDLERFLDGVATGCRVPWSDAQGRALGDRILMTWDQVKSLRKAGMSIGSHSHAHRVLQTLPPAALRADLKLARSLLEGHLDEPVRTIAYPVGELDRGGAADSQSRRRLGVRDGVHDGRRDQHPCPGGRPA